MSATRRSHLTCDNERSPFIAERRRKLFASEDQDTDSDLGAIIPISVEDAGAHTPSTRRPNESASPLGPHNHSFSHEDTLRTPRVTCTTPVLEEQKVLLEQSKSSKRPANSPGGSKPDGKSSKVRTALFPEGIALSTTSFYSKNQENFMEKLSSCKKEKIYFRPLKVTKSKQGRRPHRQFGQVNNGVRHGVRKPKQKKPGVVLYGKLRKLPEAGAALNDYIQDIAQMRNQPTAPKLIQPAAAKDLDKSTGGFEDDKENLDKPQKRPLLLGEDEAPARNVFKRLRSNDLFDETEDNNGEFETNIENILSVLDGEDSMKNTGHQKVLLDLSEESDSGPNNPANSSQMNPTDVANMILSPISQMCDVASGLAIHSPVKTRSVPSAISSRVSKMLSFNTDHHASDMERAQRKVFPIFDKDFARNQTDAERGQKRTRTEPKRSSKRFKGEETVANSDFGFYLKCVLQVCLRIKCCWMPARRDLALLYAMSAT